MAPRSAFLLVSFGGPEGPDDVLPFLRNVTAGRNVPESRLAEVAGHYYRFGGVSPINAQCRDLVAAIEKEFAAEGPGLPVYWGNRNWRPYLADTMRAMAAGGIERVVAFATSAYSSYSSCRQYLEDIDAARAGAGPAAPQVIKIPPYCLHPAFIACFTDAVSTALATLPAGLADEADLVFTAHSIPMAMSAASGPAGGAYPAQLAEVARLVAAGAGRSSWQLAYTSRSGPPAVPWLEPDLGECLAGLARSGSRAVCLVPIGFVSDHMEVMFDLDVEAAQTAGTLGLALARAATPGTDPRFVRMIAELAREHEAGGGLAEAAGQDRAPLCAAGCCGSGAARPAGRARS